MRPPAIVDRVCKCLAGSKGEACVVSLSRKESRRAGVQSPPFVVRLVWFDPVDGEEGTGPGERVSRGLELPCVHSQDCVLPAPYKIQGPRNTGASAFVAAGLD